MAKPVRTQIAQLLSSHKRRVIFAGILSLLAMFVAYEVVLHLRQRGITMVREVRVLDCPYDGNGAHTHDESCYDEAGNLVCPLEERELHTHDDSCYTEEQVLTCGLEESEGHEHTEECYDEEGNLTCELEESEGHTHTDGCYETVRTLTCEKEEITEVHVHGPGCFKTVLVDDGEEDAEESALSGEQTFTKDLKEHDVFSGEQLAVSIMVKAPVGALPAGSSLVVTPLEGDQFLQEWDGVDDLLSRELGDNAAVKRVAAVRLTLVDAQGEQITPIGSVQAKAWVDFVRDAQELVTVRLANGAPELMYDAWLVNWDEDDQASGNEDTLQFWMDSSEIAFAIVELDTALTAGGIVEQQTEQPVEQQTVQLIEQEDEQETTGSHLVEVTLDLNSDSDAEIYTEIDTELNSDTIITTEEQVTYPAQEFESRAGKVIVAVRAPEGAFPAGTTMKIEVVDTSDVKDAVTSAVSGMVETVAAVDITFYDSDGNEVEPLVPIQVTMTNDDVFDDGQPIVLHVDNEGEASVVEQTPVTNSHNEVNFDTGSL